MIGAGDPVDAQLAVTRFRREAEAAANLRSPHTVELYDFGVTDDRTLYFVMELLDGLDLESLVRQHGPLPAGRVVHMLRQVCASLEEAHVRGLVHRDIKPANIHVGRLGLVYDFVKVLDFGLVKPIADGSREHSLATQAGLIIGTPGYMAPEMAISEKVDGRADLYALGCVAYYLLTGQQVFEGGTAMQVIAKHLQAAPCHRRSAGRRGAGRPRAGRPGVSREKTGGPAAERRGTRRPARGDRCRTVDGRSGEGLVDGDGGPDWRYERAWRHGSPAAVIRRRDSPRALDQR